MKTVLINGDIGAKIDGDAVAQQLHDLVAAGEKDIQIRINSYGGNVQQGISIFSAIIALNKDGANISTHVDGFAASIASIIAIAGKSITMNDFARWMVHDAFFPGFKDSDLDAKDKEFLKNTNEMLSGILSRRGIDAGEVRSMMKKETWINSEQAKSLNLVDDVVSTKINNKAALIIGSNIPVSERFSLISNLLGHETLSNFGYVDPETFKWYAISPNESESGKAEMSLNNKGDLSKLPDDFPGYLIPEDIIKNRIENRKSQLNIKEMNELFAKLGVADESSAVAKIEALNNQVDTLNNKVAEVEGERDALQAKVDEAGKASVKTIVAQAVKDGKIAEDKQEDVCNQYGSDVEALNAMLSFIPEGEKRQTIKDQINPDGGKGKTLAEQYQDLAENDPQALVEMERSQPEKFNKLFNAWEKA